MESKTQTKQIINNLLWKIFERAGVQGVALITSIILARSLLPEDFGVIAIITIFITIANVFVQSGLGTALIQKKDTNSTDFSSVFFISLLIATILYGTLFLLAPVIARFFDLPQLKDIIRVLSLTLFPFAFNSLQSAFLIRNMQFKKLFLSSFSSTIISGAVGIIMAINNYGPWALVGQQLSSSFTVCVVMWFTVNWRPKFIFSFPRIRILFSFGWKLLVSNLINTIYNELFSLIIGKKYTSDLLGYFNRGKQFPSLIVTNIDSAIQTVMLPAYSSNQDNQLKVKQMMRRSIKTSSFLIFPAMVGLAAVGESFISIVLTDKWLPTVFFMQIYCFFYAFQPIQTANLQAIIAMGRTDVFLKLEIIKKLIGLSILSITVFFGVYAIAIGGVFSAVISTFINSYPNKKLLNYSYIEQMKDILPYFLLSIFMGAIVAGVQLIQFNTLFTLITQIISGLLIYLAGAHLFRLESYVYILNIFKGYIKKNENEIN